MTGEMGRLGELSDRVDAFFEAARAARPDAFACRPGCHACCAPGLTLTRVEADRLRGYLSGLDAPARAVVRRRAEAASGERCAALDEAGGCGVYLARPLVCRSHGLPIRLGLKGPTRLPQIDACPLNFVGEELAALPAAMVLDQATLSTVLGTLDLVHARAVGATPGEREELRVVLLQGATAAT